MDKIIRSFFCVFAFIMGVSGCSQVSPPATHVFPTNASSTAHSTVTPFPVEEPTAETTISPNDVIEELKHLLKTNGNCRFPCFWGIQPDTTTNSELHNLFHQLGKRGSETSVDNHLRVSSTFRLEERGGLYVDLQADVQNDLVRNIVVTVDGLWSPNILAQDWSAYSMDEVLSEYGLPTSVELYLDFPNKMLQFGIRLKYEKLDTSILYSGGYKLNANNLTSSDAIICPNDNISDIKLHMGKQPINYEPNGVLLSDATKLDIQTFHKMFTEDPSSCITVDLTAMGWNK